MTIEQIRARLREIVARQEEILAKPDEDLTDEEQAEFDGLADEFDKLTAKEERLVRFGAQRALMDQSPGPQTAQNTPSEQRIETRERVEDDPNMGFRNLADVALSVRAACDPGGAFDPRLRALGPPQVFGQPSNFHETSGSDGYMVPPAMREEIWELALGEESLFGAMAPEPTESNAVDIVADETTPWGATGVQANWAGEGSQMSPSRLATKGRSVKLHKLYAFVLATDELLSDAPRLNDRLTVQAARAIDWKASAAVVSGTGAGQPLGFTVADCIVTQAKETGQAADTVVAANIAKIYSRCINPGRGFFLCNPDTLPQMLTMTLGDNSVWTPPATGFINAPGGILFGRPVRLSDHCETLGDAGDVYFINPDGYYAVNKADGISFDASIHLYFDYGIDSFRWTFRIGGQPFLSAPVSPAKGSVTRSHFVRIAARA